MHAFEVINIEKEVVFKDAFNLKAEVLRFKNQLSQTQMQAQQDALTIQALEFIKSNFVGMQIQLDNTLIENEEYHAQLLTFQNKMSIIQVDLNYLQVERQELEVVATPFLEQCEDNNHTLEMGTWESSETLKTSEFDCKGQNTLPLCVFHAIEKLLKCRC